MRRLATISLLGSLIFSSTYGFSLTRPTSRMSEFADTEDATLDTPNPDQPEPDDMWDGRHYWYCNAAPARWAGHWNRRDFEAFGRNYWRVHERAERRCERFHRRCVTFCERRHPWEWDGGPGIPEGAR